MIDTRLVQELRATTGAGVLECRNALIESNGDKEKAVEILRIHGVARAVARQDKATSEGWISSYVHATGKIGVLVSLACETDFVARTSEFQQIARDIAMHVAAFSPAYIRPQDIPAAVLQKEHDLETTRVKQEGKTDVIAQKVVQGRVDKFQKENCLLTQQFLKDDAKTVEEVIAEKVIALGEKIEVKQIIRITL